MSDHQTPTTGRTRRRPPGAGVVLHAVPVLASFAVALGSLLLRDDLPGTLAVHWSGGAADGFLPVQAFTALNFVLVTLLGLGMTVAACRVPGRLEARSLAASGTGLALFLTVLHLGTLRANLGTDGVDVALPWVALLLAVGAGLLAALLGWVLAPEPSGVDDRTLEPVPVTIAPGEDVVWVGRASGPGIFVVLPVAMLVLGVVLTALAEPAAGAIVAVAGLLALSTLRVRVAVGRAGLRVRGGPFGLFGTTVPLADIEEVRAEHVTPMAYGGYGYRVRPGLRAMVVRDGPGLRVARRDRADLLVTVDGAAEAAGVLRAHLALVG